MPGEHHRCEVCGIAASRVSVLSGYFEGQPVMSHLCLLCVDDPKTSLISARQGRSRGGLGLLLISLGALLGIVVMFGDYIPGFEGTHQGIGYVQQMGIVLAAVAIFFGAVLRIDLVAMAGGMLLVLALSADMFTLHRGMGFGWKQMVAIGAVSLLVVVGLGLRIGFLTGERTRAAGKRGTREA